MDPDELSWVDSVPARPARKRRITVGEYEWLRAAPADGEPVRLTARFWINSTELVAILVEDTTIGVSGGAGQMRARQARARMGGRTYRLSVEAPAENSIG